VLHGVGVRVPSPARKTSTTVGVFFILSALFTKTDY
jgi:hypothetical protein